VQSSQKTINILIVDDEAMNLEILEMLISSNYSAMIIKA
jgi:response regulator RpfG family c-di-GMP phosphodiesterase